MTNKNSQKTIQVGDRSEHEQVSADKPLGEIGVKTLAEKNSQASPASKEINGPKGLEPTRYGDWESKGRCSDF